MLFQYRTLRINYDNVKGLFTAYAVFGCPAEDKVATFKGTGSTLEKARAAAFRNAKLSMDKSPR